MRAIERGAEQSCGGGPKSLDNQAAADIVFTSSLCNGVLASVGRLFAGARLGAMNVGGKDESMRNTVRWFLYAIAAGWAGVALAGATPAATRRRPSRPRWHTETTGLCSASIHPCRQRSSPQDEHRRRVGQPKLTPHCIRTT